MNKSSVTIEYEISTRYEDYDISENEYEYNQYPELAIEQREEFIRLLDMLYEKDKMETYLKSWMSDSAYNFKRLQIEGINIYERDDRLWMRVKARFRNPSNHTNERIRELITHLSQHRNRCGPFTHDDNKEIGLRIERVDAE